MVETPYFAEEFPVCDKESVFFSYCACRCKRYAQINSNEEGFSVLFDIMAREREWCISRLQTQGIRGLYIYLSNSCFLIRNWTCCTLSKGLVFVAIFNIILKIITQLLLLLLRNLRQWRNLKIFSLVFSFLCDLEQLLSLLFSFLFGEFGRLCKHKSYTQTWP